MAVARGSATVGLISLVCLASSLSSWGVSSLHYHLPGGPQRDSADSGYQVSWILGERETFEGGYLRLECVPYTTSDAACYSTTWLLNDRLVLTEDQGSLGIAQRIQVNRPSSESTITLLNTSLSASGLYSCYQACLDASGEWFVSEGRRHISVYPEDVFNYGIAVRRGAKLTAGYGTAGVRTGEQAIFQCHSSADVVWMSPRGYVLPGRTHGWHVSWKFGLLRTTGLLPRDHGSYTCLAQNRYGSEQATFNISMLPANVSHFVLNPAAPVVVHGEQSLRRGQSSVYWCVAELRDQPEVNITWTVPSGYESSPGPAWNSITLRNSFATTDSRQKVWCDVRERIGNRLPLATSFTTILSQDPAIRRPRKLVFNNRKLLFKVQPPPRGFSTGELDRVLGIHLLFQVGDWQWTRKIVRLTGKPVQRKFFLSDLVFGRQDVLRQLLKVNAQLHASFFDKHGEGQRATMAFRIQDVPLFLNHITATTVPGQLDAVRLQWDIPSEDGTLLPSSTQLSRLRLKVAWSDITDATNFPGWSSSRQVANIPVLPQRSVTVYDLPLSGIFRFQVWISDAAKPGRQFPIRVDRLVSFPQFPPAMRAAWLGSATPKQQPSRYAHTTTYSSPMVLTLHGQMPCSRQRQLQLASLLLADQVGKHVATLCTECDVTASIDERLVATNSSCNTALNTFNYSLTLGVIVQVYRERGVCSLLAEVEHSLRRDGGNAQLWDSSLGLFAITRVCGLKDDRIICLNAAAQQVGQQSRRRWEAEWKTEESGPQDACPT